MHNPDINSLHDLVKLLVGASAEVDVAIEQRVEEGTTVIAGFKPEEMSQIMRRFDQYNRWQKELDRNTGVLEAECRKVRKECFDWTKKMERQEQEAITKGLSEMQRKKDKAKKKSGEKGGGNKGGKGDEGGEDDEEEDGDPASGKAKKIEAAMIPMAKPGTVCLRHLPSCVCLVVPCLRTRVALQVQMLSMPTAMVPADLAAVAAAAKAGAKIALEKENEEVNEAPQIEEEDTAEDTAEDTMDRMRRIEARIRSIDLDGQRAKAAKEREPDLKTRLFMHSTGLGVKVDNLATAQEERKKKVRERLRQFNRKKEQLNKEQAKGGGKTRKGKR